MKKINHLILAIFICLITGVAAYADAGPSSGAENIPGAKGIFEFTPTDHVGNKTTWWKDTDGVAPGIAGCHIGTNENGTPNGRMFGEACLSDGLLVESNPGKDELHSHKHDVGHPDKFDCNAWCIGTGMEYGTCEIAAAPPCKQSAACSCK
jgi:hypothetical protein